MHGFSIFYLGHNLFLGPGEKFVFRKILTAFLIVCVSYFFGFYMTQVLLNGLGMAKYGNLILVQKVIYVCASVVLLGTRNVAKHFLMTYWGKQPAKVIDFIKWHFFYMFRSFIVFSVLYVFCMCLFYVLGFLSDSKISIEFWSLPMAPFYSLFCVMSIYLMCFGYPLIYNFIQAVLINLVLLVVFYGLMYVQPTVSDFGLLTFLVVCYLSMFFLVFMVFWYYLRKIVLKAIFSKEFTVDREWTANWFGSLLLDLYFFLPLMIVLGVVGYVLGYEDSGKLALCFSIGIFPF